MAITLSSANTLSSSLSQTSYTSVAFTPTASDYLLCFIGATDCTTDGVMSDSQNLGWDKLGSVVSHSTNKLIVFRSKLPAAAVSTTVTWTCSPELPSGVMIATMRCAGSDGNIRQIANNTGIASVTPSVTFGANALTTSGMIFCTLNKSNPHGTTVPTGFGARNGGNYNNPTSAIATCIRNSGHTSNQIIAGGLSPTDWTVYGVEVLNAGVGHGVTGNLTGPGSSVSGSSSRTSSSVTHETSGSLAGAGSSVASVAARFREHTTDGNLVSAGSTLSASASRTRTHEVIGSLTASGSTLSATSARTRIHSTTGELAGAESVLSAAATRYRQHDVAGVLGGQAASVDGLSIRFRVHDASATLPGHVAALSGISRIQRSHAVEGSLVGSESNITGSAASTLETMPSGTIQAIYEDHLIAATYPSHTIQATLESHTIKGSL